MANHPTVFGDFLWTTGRIGKRRRGAKIHIAGHRNTTRREDGTVNASPRPRAAGSIPHGFADVVPELWMPRDFERRERTRADQHPAIRLTARRISKRVTSSEAFTFDSVP